MSDTAVAPPYRIEFLGPGHDRLGFTCGVESLDRYLKTQATQDIRRKANTVFVLVEASAPERIAGYFTLCATALAPGDIPETVRKSLPRYPLVSATLIGRFAVASGQQGRGVGAALLTRGALMKAWESAAIIGSSMVVVDAIDERAAEFYGRFGFMRLADTPRLILPMATVGKLME